MTSRTEMVAAILKSQPEQPFTARELAEQIVQRYALELAEKRQNPKFESDEAFILQITSEVAGNSTQTIKRKYPQIQTRDEPRPRLYYWSEKAEVPELGLETVSGAGSEPEESTDSVEFNQAAFKEQIKEHALYPLLMAYLSDNHDLYCRRIDEKRSRNQHGSGGNHWLYPDIVALEPQGKDWEAVVKSCVPTHLSRLWSFEVKRKINRSNLRASFFQTVSNSSWAHFAYLVTAEISEDANKGVVKELQMLSALHGIGVMVLDPHSPEESRILIPARERLQVDWESVNRLVVENRDFEDFIELVGMYHQTGKTRSREWNR